MIIDKHLEYSDAQAVTSTAASTNVINHKSANLDVGAGRKVEAICTCVTAMTDAASNSTVAVTIETDTAAAFGSATTGQTLGTFAALSAAGTIVKGILAEGAIDEQFSRGKYTVAGGALSTGSFDFQLVLETPSTVKAYPNNYTIEG